MKKTLSSHSLLIISIELITGMLVQGQGLDLHSEIQSSIEIQRHCWHIPKDQRLQQPLVHPSS
jgi:hypothetical protein